MNTFLNIICITALLTVISSEVTARLFKNVPTPHLKIINGTTAKDGEFPYMVQLFNSDNDYACGGAIIDQKWILTAGHCVENNDIEFIVYGTNIRDIDGLPDADTVIKVKQNYQHPKFYYNHTEVDDYIPVYDVGILELAENITYTNKAQPLKLADSDDVPLHVEGVLSGWGVNFTYANHGQRNLQKVNLQLLSSLECARKIAYYAKYDIFNGTHNLCSDDNWKGECIGDSGSPFVINGTQYGLVSWSIKPCGSNPGTYSRITNPEYRSFIKNVTGI